jgi:tetratricopeptide (TPR) repeat protein
MKSHEDTKPRRYEERNLSFCPNDSIGFLRRFVSVLICVHLGFIFLCIPAYADVIMLKDGSRVEGGLQRDGDGYNVTSADGKVTHVSSGDILSIQLGKSASAGSAQDRLESLKRSVAAIDDINQIIGRYTTFIQQNKDTPAAQQAQQELALWQDRLSNGLVKVGGKWVSPELRDQIVSQANDTVAQALQLMKANRTAEADPLIQQALAIDPQNPVANYLQGVLLYRDEKLVPARKAFELVHTTMPSDAATLNNLAVIAWRQNQTITSLNYYNDAMLAMPSNKEICNNVAEALAALKDDFKKNPIAQRASRTFVEQEAQLETTMAQYGWYRWGSMWINQTQLNDLKKAEKDVQDKIDALEKKFNDGKQKIDSDNARILSDQQYLADTEQQNTFVDGSGNIYRGILPPAYYDTQREIASLQNEIASINNSFPQMQDEAKQLAGRKPKPKYSGVQNLIGVEGAPKIAGGEAVSAATPTSAPASQPAMAPSAPPPLAPVATPSTNRVF